MRAAPWLTASEAAALLGVSRPTLYAYVSRGRVRSQAMPGRSRERGYAREDIERLCRRAEGRRDPDMAAAHALHWGIPILESSITLIDGSRFYYRGHDAVMLARTRSVEEVASLIWTGRFEERGARRERRGVRSEGGGARGEGGGARGEGRGARSEIPFVSRAQRQLALDGVHDPAPFDLEAEHVAATGARILARIVAAATGAAPRGARSEGRGATGWEPPDVALGRVWNPDARAIDAIRAALILCADHELNVSSFTARCIASAGSNPYAVVIGALAALQGPRHGGASARVEAMLDSVRRSRDLRGAVRERLQRGDSIEGFGHPLYPDGDPRAIALIDLMRSSYPRSPELAFALAFSREASEAGSGHPNLDYALATVSRVLALPAGAPIVLFATGRTIGWIGHAIEQYATGQLIRPRARYVGERPMSAGGSGNMV